MTRTKGDVIVENLKVGDITYEYEYGCCIKAEIITLPVRDDEGYWSWKAKNVNNPEHIINYGVAEGHGHYGPNLYTYEAYMGCIMV